MKGKLDSADASNTAVYTVPELAIRLQCSERHIWRRILRNEIPGVVRVGRLVRVCRQSFDAWLTLAATKTE